MSIKRIRSTYIKITLWIQLMKIISVFFWCFYVIQRTENISNIFYLLFYWKTPFRRSIWLILKKLEQNKSSWKQTICVKTPSLYVEVIIFWKIKVSMQKSLPKMESQGNISRLAKLQVSSWKVSFYIP